MSQRDLIQSALEKLGPEKVKNGLMAFGTPFSRGNWERCFLGSVNGAGWAVTATILEMTLRSAFGYVSMRGVVNKALGLTREESYAVTKAFDDGPDTGVSPAELRRMAEAYLAVQQPTVVEEPEDDDLEIEVLIDLDDDSWEYESDEAEEADVVAAV